MHLKRIVDVRMRSWLIQCHFTDASCRIVKKAMYSKWNCGSINPEYIYVDLYSSLIPIFWFYTFLYYLFIFLKALQPPTKSHYYITIKSKLWGFPNIWLLLAKAITDYSFAIHVETLFVSTQNSFKHIGLRVHHIM